MAGERHDRVPPGRRHIIRRPRLTRILDQSQARVLMLVAPAGYGKTTLALQWLDDKPHAWYQGEPSTADVAALATGLTEACTPILPHIGKRIKARLRATNLPEKDVQPLAELLAEDLSSWPRDTWIAIDDYQYAIGSPAAERFLELLITTTSVPTLLITRERPRWVTARRLLYGEVHELSRATLAMDQDEVGEIFSNAGHSQAMGLLALADGWPAVIGLAANSHRSMPDEIPDALYDFFAEELFEALPAPIQLDLSRLAIAPWLTRELADALGSSLDGSLIRGEQIGVLTRDRLGRFRMHPLLRAFLLDRLSPELASRDSWARELVGLYSEQGDWDAAFAVLEVAGDQELVAQVLEDALPVLLRTGRLSTLSRWLSDVDWRNADAPIFDLAAAELAYRGGDGIQARGIAEHAASTQASGSPLRGRFLLLAGKAALLLHDTEAAMTHLNKAVGERLDPDEAYEAAWGRFLAAARLETADARELLDELASMSDGIPDRELRAMSGKWVLAVRMGCIHGLADEFEAAMHLSRQAADPTVRSAFLISRIHLLTLLARYGEALDAVHDLEAEAKEFRLEFAIPHISMAHALAHLGLRQFARASPLIGYAEDVGLKRSDVFVRMNSAALRARLLLYQGRPDDAVAHLREHWEVLPERSLHAEYLSMRALALACASHHHEAIRDSEAIVGMTQGIEAAVLNLCARGVVAARQGANEASDRASVTLRTSLETGNYDSLLLACRISPEFAEVIAQQDQCHTHLPPIVRAAGDNLLARRLGMSLPPRTSIECLTPRESEVYELLALGHTNREIAAALFISEPTAKVHTLRVFEKLGLRSRTEAALHAAEVRMSYATAASSSHGS